MFHLSDKVIFTGQEGNRNVIFLGSARKGTNAGQACVRFEDGFVAWVPMDRLSKGT